MAVKIVRQPKKIAVLGCPSSAAALRFGYERAPQALRSAGLLDRLKAVGFEVVDYGDIPAQVFKSDDEHPRARNIPAVLKSLNELRPRAEIAVKSGALPLILCGDCISVMATVAAVRRYYRNVHLIYVDRDAALNGPATTRSGSVDGMVVAQVIGRGAPELTRFWGEPPLVREPDVTLFGYERLDQPEEEYLLNSPLRRHSALEVSAAGGANAARSALERIAGGRREYVLHFDVDVISSQDFAATNLPGEGGLTWNETREALGVFARQPTLAAMEVAAFNPELDPDGNAARKLVDLISEVLANRLVVDAPPAEAEPVLDSASAAPLSSEHKPMSA